jgi:transcriptional regulator with XRE-family HTH domain
MADDKRDPVLGPIGERIRQRRRELGLTQEALADAAGLSKSFISEMETGLAAANGLLYLRVAAALDVEVQWLLTGLVPERASRPVSVPPLLSKIAEEKGWSHKRTLDVAAALGAVVARRTLEGRRWEPTRDEILRIASALPDEDRK